MVIVQVKPRYSSVKTGASFSNITTHNRCGRTFAGKIEFPDGEFTGEELEQIEKDPILTLTLKDGEPGQAEAETTEPEAPPVETPAETDEPTEAPEAPEVPEENLDEEPPVEKKETGYEDADTGVDIPLAELGSKELKELCVKEGVSKRGSKAKMIERLEIAGY